MSRTNLVQWWTSRPSLESWLGLGDGGFVTVGDFRCEIINGAMGLGWHAKMSPRGSSSQVTLHPWRDMPKCHSKGTLPPKAKPFVILHKKSSLVTPHPLPSLQTFQFLLVVMHHSTEFVLGMVPGLVKGVAVAPLPGHYAGTVSVPYATSIYNILTVYIHKFFNQFFTDRVNNCTPILW